MKFTTKQSELLKSIKVALRAVGGGSTLPILSHLHMLVSDKTLTVTGTNLEIWSQSQVALEGDVEPGDVTLPAAKLDQLVASYSSDTEIAFHHEDADERPSKKVSITAGWNVSQKFGFPGEEFPQPPDVKEEAAFSISAVGFGKVVRRAIYAVSTDTTRLVLTALNFEVREPLLGDSSGENVLVVTATDTHRLVCRQIRIRQTNPMGGAWMVPGSVANQVVNVTEKDESDLLISFSREMVRVLSASGTITARLVQGVYPNYERLLPSGHDITLIPDRAELVTTLKRVHLFSMDSMSRVVFDVQGAKLVLSGESGTVGEAKETLDIACEGGDTRFAVNARYLIQALQAESSEAVRFECTEPLRPFVVVPHGQTDSDVLGVQLLMPMQVI